MLAPAQVMVTQVTVAPAVPVFVSTREGDDDDVAHTKSLELPEAQVPAARLDRSVNVIDWVADLHRGRAGSPDKARPEYKTPTPAPSPD